MNKIFTISVIALSLGLTACTQTTKSAFGDDRSQLLLVSSEQLNKEAKTAYDQVIAQAKAANVLNTDKALTQRVNSVSKKLIAVAPEIRADSKDWDWEVNTITDSTVNAWCMPGGKIVVYTGLNDQLKLNDDELAAVLGHEISHALKEHSREAASKDSIVSGLASIANLFGISKSTTNLAKVAYNAGLSTSFSRSQETEADRYGTELMYRASFDTNGAVTVFTKLGNLEKKSGTSSNILSSMLSTHPSSETRVEDLKKMISKYKLNSHKD